MNAWLTHHSQKLILLCVAALLLIELVMQVKLAHTDSQTTDEAVHLSAGYTYLTRGDFRFNPEHPPLVKMLAALPILLVHPHDPSNTSLWGNASNFFYDNWRENRQFGDDFLYQSGNNADQLLFLARLPIVALTLLLGMVIFLTSRVIFGTTAGLFSLALYSFDPGVVAHGHLVTTDIAVSLGFFSTLWMLWRYLSKSTWKRLMALSIVLALTELAKFTSVIVLPIIALALGWLLIKHKKHSISPLTLFSHWIVGLAIVWIVIIAAYGFDLRNAPASPSITHAIVATVDAKYSALANTVQASKADRVYSALHSVMMPRYYFKGLVMILTHVSSGHGTFLLGNISQTGWWYYFPLLLLAKLPISTILILVLLGLVLARRKKPDAAIFLTLSALAFLAIAMLSKANLGIRHVLPVLPPLYVAAGVLMHASKRIRAIAGTLAVLTIIITTLAYPFELGYFNFLFGGSRNGVNVATDSNLDWGQDLKRIKQYVVHNSLTDAMIVYPWDSEGALDFYHIPRIPYRRLSESEASTIIIGATFLHDPQYSWLLSREPTAYISPGVFVYIFGQQL